MASSSSWSRRQEKIFENAVIVYNKDTPDRWLKVAKTVGGGKTPEEVEIHYQELYSSWTWHQNKLYENALVEYGQSTMNRWKKVAKAVGGGKTAMDVEIHYQKLLEDLEKIESGKVPLPNYTS